MGSYFLSGSRASHPSHTIEATIVVMTTNPEAQLEAFFRKRVQLLGGYTIKLAPTEAGIPDRLVVMPGGRLYLVELKTDTGQLRPIQAHWHNTLLERTGVKVHVVRGTEGVVRWLRRITVESTENRGGRRRRTA